MQTGRKETYEGRRRSVSSERRSGGEKWNVVYRCSRVGGKARLPVVSVWPVG